MFLISSLSKHILTSSRDSRYSSEVPFSEIVVMIKRDRALDSVVWIEEEGYIDLGMPSFTPQLQQIEGMYCV